MREAQVEKEREVKRVEARYNEEIEEMENLLYEVLNLKLHEFASAAFFWDFTLCWSWEAYYIAAYS